MGLYLVQGVNGLGNTSGTVEGGEKLVENLNYERVNLNNDNISEQLGQLEDFSRKIFSEDSEEKKVFVGGDHSISYPLVKGFVEKSKGKAKLIVFDAHADLMPVMREPTHEEWLRALIEETGLSGDQILLIGLRDRVIESEEKEYLEEKGILRVGLSEDIKSKIEEFISEGDEVYVSFDIDVFDGKLVEGGTGYPVSGGFSEEEGLELVRFLSQEMGVKYWDLVEVASNGEDNGAIELGRKVLSSILN
jgi:arginase family enzyme